MKKIEKPYSHLLMYYTMSLFMIAIFLQSCGSVPVTGRKQLQLVSDQQVVALSLQQYNEFIKQAPLEKGTKEAQMVSRVGSRIATAVETYLKNNGYQNDLQNFRWDFNLVKSKQVNAFAMPGGKVVAYEGLLPLTKDENGLAVVIGHEIAHVVAKHANERLSQQMALQYGGAIVGGILGGSSQITQQIAGAVFGLGAQYGVMLPYSRKHEYEADEMGLIFMAMAGYDPRTAVSFWQRMASQSGKQSAPEFASTHPSDQNRINNIQNLMEKALSYYHGPAVQNKTTERIKTKTKVPAPIVNTSTAKTSSDWKF